MNTVLSVSPPHLPSRPHLRNRTTTAHTCDTCHKILCEIYGPPLFSSHILPLRMAMLSPWATTLWVRCLVLSVVQKHGLDSTASLLSLELSVGCYPAARLYSTLSHFMTCRHIRRLHVFAALLMSWGQPRPFKQNSELFPSACFYHLFMCSM